MGRERALSVAPASSRPNAGAWMCWRKGQTDPLAQRWAGILPALRKDLPGW